MTGLDAGDDLRQARHVRRHRHIEEVGAGGLEGLDPADRLGGVVGPVHDAVGARAEDEWPSEGLRRRCRRPDPLDGEVEGIGRIAVDHHRVFDGTSGKACFGGQSDRLGDIAGSVGESVLEIAGDGQVRVGDDLLGMGKRLVAGDVTHVRAAEREGETGAGGRQRLRAQAPA